MWLTGYMSMKLALGNNIVWILTRSISLTALSRLNKWVTILPGLKSGIHAYLPWWLRQYSVCLQCRRPRFNPWVGKISQRRKWQPTPVFLPGKISWTEEPGGLQAMGSQTVGHDWATSLSLFTCISSLEGLQKNLRPFAKPLYNINKYIYLY